uniref:Cyclin-dependent kinase 20 n=1 Tax=Timema poppense TaxID=170557 RepID=A0A7R9GRY9_TIMPO|nr:unnamed protein product [Timema poppensis]
MEQFKVVGKIGEGAHGLVLRGQHLVTGCQVALKKVTLKKLEDGIPNSVIREIKALQEVDCDYVVKLLDSFPQGLGFVLVFEYMPSGLWEMLNDATKPLTESQKKSYMIMLLRGVAYLHSQSIMHRDLKPANLLIGQDGVLKIADLGLARTFWDDQTRPYSHQVATRWYRAPELLYGARNYSQAVDLWAVGCILGEMQNNHPLFPGETDIEQLAIVLRTLGTPTEESWPGMSTLPDYNKITFPHSAGVPWKRILPNSSPEAVDLIKEFLLYHSENRLQAEQVSRLYFGRLSLNGHTNYVSSLSRLALIHPYFFTIPLPCIMTDMPKPSDGHRHQFKTKEYDVDLPLEEMFKTLNEMLGPEATIH